MKQLYYVRHGESEFNRAKKWAGTSNPPLTPKGHEQAKAAGRQAREAGLVFDIIISSPLERAHHTAKHIATELGYPHEKILVHPYLIERGFGELEGRQDLVASAKALLDESSVDAYKDAESLVSLQNRANELLTYLNGLPNHRVLVVGHGAAGRALRRAINKEPLHYRGESLDNADIIQLI